MKRLFIIFLVMAVASLNITVLQCFAQQNYLDISVGSEGDGSSWATAYKSLSNAIARMPAAGVTNLWVAQGTYIVASVDIKTNSIFGGYPTTGGTRDWANNLSIFDANFTNRSLRKTVSGTVMIDGLTIRNGTNAGAAIYCQAGNINVANCIFTNNNSGGKGGAIHCVLAGSNNFNNCTFMSNTCSGGGGAIYFDAVSTNVFQSCSFITNNSLTAGNGGALCENAAGGVLIINNCIFTNNMQNSSGNGGAIYSQGRLEMYNSVICSNYAAGGGGGVYGGGSIYHSSANISNIFTNCIFNGNRITTAVGGGAIYFVAQCTNIILSCSFITNIAGSGGALYEKGIDGFMRIDNCVFTNNKANSWGIGGAIFSKGRFEMYNSLVCSNYSSAGGGGYGGGGIYNSNTSVSANNLTNCTFTGNRVESSTGGGAIWFNGSSTSIIQSCYFVSNSIKTAGRGGAIYAKGELDVRGSMFCTNLSINPGGAIFNTNAGRTTLSQSAFIANWGAGAGAVKLTGTNNYVINCTFLTNYASGNGGAILNASISTLNVTNCIFWGNRSSGTGTNIQNGGTVNISYCNMGTSANEVNGGTKNLGSGIIKADPLFVSAVEPYDVHEKSLYGHYSNGTWVIDAVTSPCIDAGVPYDAAKTESFFSNEPNGNGDRINLGCYGNTIEASRSSLPLLNSGTIITIE